MEKYNAQEQKVIGSLQSLKQVEADAVFLKTLRAKLLRQIEGEAQFQAQPRLFWNFSKVALTLAAFLLLLGGTGLGISKASQVSDPANILYKVRLTSEKIQLSFAEDKSTLHAKFAKNRLADLQNLEQNQKLADTNLNSVLGLYLENLTALQKETELLSLNDPEFSATALKLESQLRDLQATIAQLNSRLQSDSLTSQALASIQEAEALSLWNRQLISIKILDFQRSQNVLLGNDNADQLERIAILLSKVNNRFAVLDAKWQETFNQKDQTLTQSSSLAPENQANFTLTEKERTILGEVGQVKTDLNEAQALLSQNPEPTSEIMLSVINKLFEIDNNLAKIEILLE